jgi:NhaA family Na+:H+ antiporter
MKINPVDFVAKGRESLDRFEQAADHPLETVLANRNRHSALLELDLHTDLAQTPLQRLETALHPWVSILVLPLFAFANAGVALEGGIGQVLTQPVTLGIVLGLVIGKQIGVTVFSWIAVRSGLAQLPAGVSWMHIYGVSWLAGIGFTMSLFIGGLAFSDAEHLVMAKVGVLAASVVAGVGGAVILRKTSR